MKAFATTVALGFALSLGALATARAQVSPVPAVSPAPPAAPAPSPEASAPVAPEPTEAPWPTNPQPVDTYDVEVGAQNSWLNSGAGKWNGSYASLFYSAPSGFKAYTGALDTVRFGHNDPGYYAGLYVPTKIPNGTLNVEYGFSPTHFNIPANYWLVGYDLRLNGGFGVQAGYGNRSYTNDEVPTVNLGFDNYFGDDRIAYSANIATISGTPGTGFSQTISWGKTLPSDSITVAANFGRDIESTGPGKVAFYDTFVVAVDDMHWIDSRFAIHGDVNYNTLAGAYQRYEALLGLHVRL